MTSTFGAHGKTGAAKSFRSTCQNRFKTSFWTTSNVIWPIQTYHLFLNSMDLFVSLNFFFIFAVDVVDVYIHAVYLFFSDPCSET